MTRRRRTGRAALLLPLGAAVLAAACARPPRTGARIVSEGSLRALPKESVGLLVLEVGSLRRRPICMIGTRPCFIPANTD